jgi:hypothetical protein
MAVNLVLVRSIVAPWEGGDWSSADWADPEIEFVVADGPAPGSSTGVAGMAKAWGETLSAFRDFRARAEEYRELDDERVLVLIRVSGRGKTSGLEIEQLGSRGGTAVPYPRRRGYEVRQLLRPLPCARRPRPRSGVRLLAASAHV